MAAGDLITGPGQIEWEGLLIGAAIGGPGIYFDPVELRGFADLPALDSADTPRARSHGSIPGPSYARQQTYTVPLKLIGAAYLADQIDALEAATALHGDERPLVWNLGRGTWRADVRVTERQIATAIRDLSQGVSRAVLQWTATDPRAYSNTLKSDSTGVGTVTGGLSFPHGFPHGFGSATPGTIPVSNDGNTPAPWTATLAGPLTSPVITLVGESGRLELTGFTLADGDTLELDSTARTVLLNGTASRYSSLTARDWFDLPVGDSLIQLSAASGTGTLTGRWRDTRL